MIWTLFRYKWKRIMKQPALLLSIMFFPFIFIGFFLFFIAQTIDESTDRIHVAIVDEDQTFETKTLANQLQAEDALSEVLRMRSLDEEQAKQELAANKITAVIYIPEGFTADLRTGINTPIQVTTNNQNVFSSSMVKMLLNSGAKYISAAQSGINTLYDLYIQDLPPEEDPQSMLQQMIVNYTLFALNRNDLFETEQVESGASIGWENHGVIAFLLTSILISSLFLQIFTHRESSQGLEDRMRTLGSTSFTFMWSQYMYYVGFLFVNVSILNGILFVLTDLDWLFHGLTLITWLIVSLTAALLLCFLEWYLDNQTTRTNIYLLLVFAGLLISGVWIPVIYLPDWIEQILSISPFHHIYQAFAGTITFGDNPFDHWGYLLAGWLVFAVVLMTGIWRREQKNGYISYPFK